MDKKITIVSNGLLLLIIASSFVMWTAGLGYQSTSFLYENYGYFLAVMLITILLLKIKDIKKQDMMIIGVAVAIFIGYTLTSPIRQSNRFINIVLPLIMLFLLCFKKSQFFKRDYWGLLLVSGTSFLITLYRIYTELPKIVPIKQIWQPDNTLEEIWINTNTIGASLLLAVMLISTSIKYLDSSYLKLLNLPICLVGLVAIWVCQAKTAFLVLILFILLDNVIPKKILQHQLTWVSIFSGLFLTFPLLFSYLAFSDSINIFSGRENIWKEFLENWVTNKQQILIGMKPFVFHWKQLGMHNSYFSILNNYGIVGYLIFSLSYILGVKIYQIKQKIPKKQVMFLIAMFVVLLLSTMENLLLSLHWLPLIFSFYGLYLANKNVSHDI